MSLNITFDWNVNAITPEKNNNPPSKHEKKTLEAFTHNEDIKRCMNNLNNLVVANAHVMSF